MWPKPVDPDAFSYVFNLASAAMDRRLLPGSIPTMVGKTIDIEFEPGNLQSVTFQDKAIVRMMDAIASHATTAPERVSFAARIFHLYGLLETAAAKPFLRLKNDERLLHPAVLAVAAGHPIDINTGFDCGFFEEVAQMAGLMAVPEP